MHVFSILKLRYNIYIIQYKILIFRDPHLCMTIFQKLLLSWKYITSSIHRILWTSSWSILIYPFKETPILTSYQTLILPILEIYIKSNFIVYTHYIWIPSLFWEICTWIRRLVFLFTEYTTFIFIDLLVVTWVFPIWNNLDKIHRRYFVSSLRLFGSSGFMMWNV